MKLIQLINTTNRPLNVWGVRLDPLQRKNVDPGSKDWKNNLFVKCGHVILSEVNVSETLDELDDAVDFSSDALVVSEEFDRAKVVDTIASALGTNDADAPDYEKVNAGDLSTENKDPKKKDGKKRGRKKKTTKRKG